MRFVTWNIRLGLQEGLDALLHHLAAQEADVVALQEVGRHWWMGPKGDTTERLAQGLGLYGFFVPCIRAAGGAEYGHALLSRWPIERPRLVDLPQTHDEPRRLLETAVQTPKGRICVLSTHLSHIDDRDPQGELVRDWFRGCPSPAVLLGDLNTGDATWLRDMAGFSTRCVDAATYPAEAPTERIDHVLIRGFELKSAQVVDTGHASDHRMVVVDIIS